MPKEKKTVSVKHTEMDDLLTDAIREVRSHIQPISTDKSSIEIVNNDIFVEWHDIPDSNKTKYPRENIDEWTNRDLYYYIKQKAIGSFGAENFASSLARGQTDLQELNLKIKTLLKSQANPKTMKMFIDWYFDNQAQNTYERYSCFKIRFLLWERTLANFVSYYKGINGSPMPVVVESEIRQIDDECSKGIEKFNEAFKASKTSLLLFGGILGTIQYLMLQKKFSETDATQYVTSGCIDLCKRSPKIFDSIKIATENRNPYPDWCKIESLTSVLCSLDKATGKPYSSIQIEFSKKTQKLQFLKEI